MQKRIIFLLLLFGSALNTMDWVAFSALAPLVRSELRLDAGQIGLALGAFSVGLTTFVLVGGWFTDRFGAGRALIVIILGSSLMCGLIGVVVGLRSLLLVCFLFGSRNLPGRPVQTR